MRFALLSLLLVGCGSSSSSSNQPTDPPEEGGTTSESGVDATGDETSTGDDSSTGSDTSTPADTGPSIKFCQMTCATASDCVATGAAFDADNYACEGGFCRWTGCKSDAECESTYMSKSYGCFAMSGLKTCLKKCSAPTDCVVAGSKMYDADNWACDAGACRWLGCNSDDECTALGAYVCRADATTGLKNCLKKCSAPADCATASAAFDADNYACESGVCRYTGCNTDAECKSSLMKSNYACK